VRGAYDALVSMTIIWYFIPFLFLFPAAIKLRGELSLPGFRVPGGRAGVVVFGVLGMITTLASIVLSLYPSDNEAHPGWAIFKVVGLTVVMLAAGVGVYWKGRRAARAPGISASQA
jgi:hypothetical protein